MWLWKEDYLTKLSHHIQLSPKHADGSTVWSTNISSKSVASLNLTKTCNLMLLDDNNATIIWQSFDHPTDTLVLGQKLVAGQQLISQVDCIRSLSTAKVCFLISILILPNAIILLILFGKVKIMSISVMGYLRIEE